MAGTEGSFPEADINGDLNPALGQYVDVDPISSDIATSLTMKEKEEAAQKKKAEERKDCMQTLKSTIIISAVVAAVAGAAFVITKKLKEK